MNMGRKRRQGEKRFSRWQERERAKESARKEKEILKQKAKR